MEQRRLKAGDWVECIDAKNRRELKEGHLYQVEKAPRHSSNIFLRGIAVGYAARRFKLAQSALVCDHDWKRLDLFRTTEFCCTKCPAKREFDKERDAA